MSNLNFNDGKPPIVLAVDTSSACAGFALARGNELIASLNSDAAVPHSRTFFLQIAQLLKTAGIGLGEIEIFAVATGPGSFTGLRVGLAAVRGLAHSLGKPAVGINSIDAMALSAKVVGDVLVLIAAGRNEVYSGVRRVTKNGEIERLGADQVGSLASVVNSDWKSQALFVAGSISKELIKVPNWHFNACLTSVAETIALCVPAISMGNADSSLRPHYVRPSDAEIKRKD